MPKSETRNPEDEIRIATLELRLPCALACKDQKLVSPI